MAPSQPHHKAPPVRTPVPSLPVARLNRLGADADTLALYRSLWNRFGENPGAARNRDRLLHHLSDLTDRELAEQISGVGRLRDMGVGPTMSWVRLQADPSMAAALVMETEMGRDEGRPSLRAKLVPFLRVFEPPL